MHISRCLRLLKKHPDRLLCSTIAFCIEQWHCIHSLQSCCPTRSIKPRLIGIPDSDTLRGEISSPPTNFLSLFSVVLII